MLSLSSTFLKHNWSTIPKAHTPPPSSCLFSQEGLCPESGLTWFLSWDYFPFSHCDSVSQILSLIPLGVSWPKFNSGHKTGQDVTFDHWFMLSPMTSCQRMGIGMVEKAGEEKRKRCECECECVCVCVCGVWKNQAETWENKSNTLGSFCFQENFGISESDRAGTISISQKFEISRLNILSCSKHTKRNPPIRKRNKVKNRTNICLFFHLWKSNQM